MNLSDTLTVSILGITIVFIGLILTTLLIYSFRLKEKFQFKRKIKSEDKGVGSVSEQKIPQEIIAVLTTVLEIEMRIRGPFSSQKFTFKTER